MKIGKNGEPQHLAKLRVFKKLDFGFGCTLHHTPVNFSSCQRNLIKTFQIEVMIALITNMTLIFFMRLVKWLKIAVKKSQKFKKF